MKTILALGLLMISLVAAQAAEKEIWYDANGKVVKVTKAQKEKRVYVPDWKKREQARLARMQAQRIERSASSRSSRVSYWDPYATYYSGYGYQHRPYYYSHGWSCRPASHYRSGHRHSSLRFNGSYRGSGWSVRVRF